MGKFQKAVKCLNEINDIASTAQNSDTKEPLYYDFINRTEELRQLITPWWLIIYHKWKASRPIRDDEIPF